jgi:hypothetical protein
MAELLFVFSISAAIYAFLNEVAGVDVTTDFERR